MYIALTDDAKSEKKVKFYEKLGEVCEEIIKIDIVVIM